MSYFMAGGCRICIYDYLTGIALTMRHEEVSAPFVFFLRYAEELSEFRAFRVGAIRLQFSFEI